VLCLLGYRFPLYGTPLSLSTIFSVDFVPSSARNRPLLCTVKPPNLSSTGPNTPHGPLGFPRGIAVPSAMAPYACAANGSRRTAGVRASGLHGCSHASAATVSKSAPAPFTKDRAAESSIGLC
jgi:hypothetical protein